jgi:hypothetical protein
MGMRGTGPVRQAFLGSTVAGVIQAGKLPVLAMPLQAVLKDRLLQPLGQQASMVIAGIVMFHT